MTEREAAMHHLRARGAYQAGSLDWLWHSRAAWKLDQMSRGVPARDWTDEPPGGFDRPGSIASVIGAQHDRRISA